MLTISAKEQLYVVAIPIAILGSSSSFQCLTNKCDNNKIYIINYAWKYNTHRET